MYSKTRSEKDGRATKGTTIEEQKKVYSTHVSNCSGQAVAGEHNHVVLYNYYYSLTVNVNSERNILKQSASKKKRKKRRKKKTKKTSGIEGWEDVESDYVGTAGSVLAGPNETIEKYGVKVKEAYRQSRGTVNTTGRTEQLREFHNIQGSYIEETRLGQAEMLQQRLFDVIPQKQGNQCNKTDADQVKWEQARTRLEDSMGDENQRKERLEASTCRNAAIRQSIGFALCIFLSIFCDVTSYLPYFQYAVFLVNNLFTCYAFYIDARFIASRQSLPFHTRTRENAEVAGPFSFFYAATYGQIQGVTREEEFIRTLLAVLVSVSLGFFSSLLFGCYSCAFDHTMVILVSGTLPYVSFLKNTKFTMTFAIEEHCRVFRKEFKRSRERRRKRRNHIKTV